MATNYVITVPPVDGALAVTVEEVKQQLNISFNDDDVLIEGYILAAQELIEGYLNILLFPQTIEGQFDALECKRSERYPFVEYKRAPFRDLVAVQYWNGTEYVDMDSTNYVVKLTNIGFPRLIICDSSSLTSSTSDCIAYPLHMEAEVGYEDADSIPDAIKLGIKQLVGYLYDNRGDCSDCDGCDVGAILPKSTRMLISRYKITGMFA